MRRPRAKAGAVPPPVADPDVVAPPLEPAIEARGDYTIALQGEDHVLRPTFAAIGAIETACGATLVELTRAAEAGRLSTHQVGVIATECINAHRRAAGVSGAFDQARVAGLIYASPGGVLACIRFTLTPLLLLALTGGYTASGERQPATMTSPTSGPVSGNN